MNTFSIVSLNISEKKGDKKVPVPSVTLKAQHGIIGDAHVGEWHRQVSLLAVEDIQYMQDKGADVSPGDFAENITTRGVILSDLPIGSVLLIGNSELEITQIGKECHTGCEIMKQVGECIMPKRGVFAKVLKGGEIDCEASCSYSL
jgi:MOSC domain-containing protein YiiM